ncbi:MAG TPA: M1 family metallopeptidase [Gammaproteobacteria bacterium]|nr:M1 family metallopeptidase [Gammaproteobacteria bacterium]
MDVRSLVTGLLLMSVSITAVAATPERIVLPGGVVPLHYALTLTPDASKLAFTGSVQIDLDVKQATRSIQLNAADLTFTKVSLPGISETPSVTFDGEHETATLSFKSPVSAGRHRLDIEYTGKISQHAAGFFALDYDTASGKQRALFTQLENSDARRVLPCWDEPGIKASFTLTAVVPAAEMALSNTPAVKTTPLAGGLARVEFAPTPKMSSYLLFFGLGDFERISKKVDGVDVGVVVKRGDADKAKFVLDAAVQLLPWYEDYFGVKYPLAKLDLVGGPGQSQFFGAMENWGAIFSFERALILDPKISTEEDLRRVYIITAHEMAHQWFGDLVTMEWWDDLWLNEGFASWMEYKATDHFHPEWKPWLDSVSAKENAMRLDARDGSHPIVTPIYDVLQASQAFDSITYSKGQAIVRMLEAYVGEDAFRQGVRAYIKAHAYGNTVTDDLWRELDKASKESITQVAHDFTLQAGIPLVQADCNETGLRLTQARFTADGAGQPAGNWHVPVNIASVDGTPLWHGFVSADKPVDVPLKSGVVPLVNAGQGGYYRVLYDGPSFGRLAARFEDLSPTDQLGLLNDSQALGYAGYESLTDFLQLTRHASANLDPMVTRTLVDQLEELDSLYEGLPGQAAFKAYGRKTLAPVFAKVGWDGKPGEDQNITLLRSDLLGALGKFNDPDVVKEAHARFAKYLKDPASLNADLRQAVLDIVADHADAATWDQLHALAQAATSNLEKRQLYVYLGSAHDPALVQKALALSLTEEVPTTTRPAILAATSNYYPELALDFLSAHEKLFESLIEPASRNRFGPRLAASARDTAIIAKLRTYAERNIPESARSDVTKAEAAITENARIREKRLPQVDAWLKTHAG